jgi:tetratricopeptide (TPR) repeat protein
MGLTNPMHDREKSFTYSLLRPYFDLRVAPDGPLMTIGPLVAYESLVRGTSLPGAQRVLSGGFRESLRICSGIEGTAVASPTELADDARSEAWHHLCDRVERYDDLAPADAARTVRLLIYLSFHRLVLRLVRRPSPAEIAESHSVAALAFLRAFARNVLNGTALTRVDDLEDVVEHSPRECRSRFYAATALLVYHAKVMQDAGAAKACREVMREFARPSDEHRDFVAILDAGRYYRSASYVPQLEGDAAEVVREMDECERLAHAARGAATTELERSVAEENLHPVLESRMREALWLGDEELAADRMERLVEHDPLDAKSHVERGELFIRRREFEAAVASFERAAVLGPPGVAPAWYMAGWCHEQLGQYERAAAAYADAARIDPHGLSPLSDLAGLQHPGRLRPLNRWARGRLENLRCIGLAPEDVADVLGAVATDDDAVKNGATQEAAHA